MRTIRLAFGLATFLLAVTASTPALADVTITGTVGEVGIMAPQSNGQLNYGVIRFKLTDVNQTKTCAQANTPNVGGAYAWFWGATQIVTSGNQYLHPDPDYREWYAALLVSKKGAQISCTINDANSCHVTSCTLP